MSVYDRLHERLREREAKGLAEYGEAVEDAPVDFLEEAIDELLDACAYLEAHRLSARWTMASLSAMYFCPWCGIKGPKGWITQHLHLDSCDGLK